MVKETLHILYKAHTFAHKNWGAKRMEYSEMAKERKRFLVVYIPLKDFDRTGAHHHCNRCF